MPGEITAAPTEIEFVGGEKYLFYPLVDQDLIELDNWLQARVLKLTRASFDENTTEAEREMQLTIATREALRTTFMSMEGIALLSTAPGIVHICWMSVRKHCELSEAELTTLIMGNPENFNRVMDAYSSVNGIPDRLIKSTRAKVEKTLKKQGKNKNPTKARKR